MKSVRKQRGASIWMILLVVVCLAFSGIIGLKLFPVYLESYQIDRAMSAVLGESDIDSLTKREVRDAMLRRLDIDGVTEVNFHNFWEVVTMEKEDQTVTLNVTYEVIVPLVGNVSALVEFDKTATN